MKKLSPLDPNMSSSSASMSNDLVNDGDHWYNLEPVFSINWIWTAIALSFTTFSLLNHLLFRLNWWMDYFRQTHKSQASDPDHRLNPLAKLQRPAIQESYEDWKWRNIVVSFVHSLLSGSIALYLSYDLFCSRRSLLGAANWDPDSDDTFRLAICFSIGYFLYDTLLSVSKLGTYPDRLEIIVHHTITTATLVWVIVPGWKWQQFQIYCIFGLIIELSNVFIHIRSLETLKRTRTTTGSTGSLSTFNSLCAIVSIFLFRFYPLTRIWLDLYNNRSNFKWLFPLASVPMLSFTLISIVILWRIVKEDFGLTKMTTNTTATIDRRPRKRRQQRPLTTRPGNFSNEIPPPSSTLPATYSNTDSDLRCDVDVKKHQ